MFNRSGSGHQKHIQAIIEKVAAVELQELKKIDVQEDKAQNELETLSKQLNKLEADDKNELAPVNQFDSKVKLKELIEKYVTKYATASVELQISDALKKASGLLQEHMALEKIDKWLAWEALQKRYLTILHQFIQEQLREPITRPQKLAIAIRSFQKTLNDYLKKIITKNNSNVSAKLDALNNFIFFLLTPAAKDSTLAMTKLNAAIDDIKKENASFDTSALNNVRNLLALVIGQQTFNEFQARVDSFIQTNEADVKFMEEYKKNEDNLQENIMDIDAKEHPSDKIAETIKSNMNAVLFSVDEKTENENLKLLAKNFKDNKANFFKDDLVFILNVIDNLSSFNKNKLKSSFASKEVDVITLESYLRKNAANNSVALRDDIKKYIVREKAKAEKMSELLQDVSDTFGIEHEFSLDTLTITLHGLNARKIEVLQAVDQKLLKALQNQAVTAAKQYFNREKGGFFKETLHAMHHNKEKEEQNKVELFIETLLSPETKTFKQGAEQVIEFLSHYPNPLHTNSYDTLFLKVLFNESAPRGFFIREASVENPEQKLPAEEKLTDKAAINQYIHAPFPANTKPSYSGTIVDKLSSKDKREAVKNKAVQNLKDLITETQQYRQDDNEIKNNLNISRG